MKKLTIAAFAALMALFVVGCGEPGDGMEEGMEGMEQQQDDAMGQNDGFGQDDGMDQGDGFGQDDGMDQQDDGFGDDAYGDGEGEQDW